MANEAFQQQLRNIEAALNANDSQPEFLPNVRDQIQKTEQFVQSVNSPQLTEAWNNYKKEKSNEVKNKGNAVLASGNNEGAAAYFSICIDLDPSNYVFWSNRSAAHTALGRYHEAIEDADKVISINPGWARGYGRKAVACFFLKRYDDSLAAYQNGLKIEPINDSFKSGLKQVEDKVKAQNANERGEELISKGKLAEAINSFSDAIQLDQTESAFYGNRFDAYMKSGLYQKALEDADQCIRLRPDWSKGFQRRAEALTRLDRYDESAASYGAAIQRDPGNSKLSMDMNATIQEGVRYRMRKEMEQKAQTSAEQPK